MVNRASRRNGRDESEGIGRQSGVPMLLVHVFVFAIGV